ncbi:MAG TPA: hypothetical protein VFB12_09120 [Ktedonobacteraceae bacterium]|nr:hypothetical protein [Ktedonobacteraceae bacterium]
MKHNVVRSVLTPLSAAVAVFDIAEGILALTRVCIPDVKFQGTPWSPPTCTSSPDAHWHSMDGWGPVMRLRSLSSSTRWATERNRCWDPTRRNGSPTPCTPPG